MSKRKIIIILISAVLLVVFSFLYFYYPKYKLQRELSKYDKKAQEAFPDKPRISDIQNPKIIEKTNISYIYFPYIEKNNLYYLSSDQNFYKLDLSTFETLKLQTLEVNYGNIKNIKFWSISKMILFYLNPDINLPAEEEGSKIFISLFDSNTGMIKLLSYNTVDALWLDENNIISLEKEGMNYLLYQLNLLNNKKNILFNFGSTEITLLDRQNQIINNDLFYTKLDGENNLYNLDLKAQAENKIYTNILDANISPNGNYIILNFLKNGDMKSMIYNLQTKKPIYNFKYPILLSRSIWDKKGENLYYAVGENLKVGNARKASYVFFKFDINRNQEIQLTNHEPDNLIDPAYILLNENEDKLYFINTSKDILQFINLTL